MCLFLPDSISFHMLHNCKQQVMFHSISSLYSSAAECNQLKLSQAIPQFHAEIRGCINERRSRDSNLYVLNRGSRFATIRIATGSQRTQIARFESQGQTKFESLLRLCYFSLLR